MVHNAILNIVLCTILSRTLLLIHFKYKILHLLTPTSYFICPPIPYHLATSSLFSMFVILFLFHR